MSFFRQPQGPPQQRMGMPPNVGGPPQGPGVLPPNMRGPQAAFGGPQQPFPQQGPQSDPYVPPPSFQGLPQGPLQGPPRGPLPPPMQRPPSVQQQPPQQPPAPPKTEPPKLKHPAGDRSNIPSGLQGVVMMVVRGTGRLKEVLGVSAPTRRIVYQHSLTSNFSHPKNE